MVLDKRCPVDPLDWQTLIEFLGAGDGATAFLGARNRYHCSYVIYTDGTYYYSENGETGELDFGGSTNEGGASGTSPLAVIQATIDALTTTGGKISIKRGVYIVTATLTYRENIVIEGESQTDDTGPFLGTRLARNGNFPIFTPAAGTLRHFVLRDLSLEGTAKGAGATGLFLMTAATSHILMENVSFLYSGGPGVDMDDASWHLTMINCRAQSLTGALVYKVTPDLGTLVTLINCIATYGGPLAELYGVKGVNIIGGGGDNWDGDGIQLNSCAGNVLGTDIEGDVGGTLGHGIEIINHRGLISGNRILWFGNIGNTVFPFMVTSTCQGTTILSNTTELTVSANSLSLDATCRDIRIENNVFDVTILDGAADVSNRFRGNIGYVTENRGTATIAAAATAIVVPHGCNYTPNASDIKVFLTNLPTNDIGDVYFSAIGAANFTINCRNVPGVATAIFAWGVDRTP